MFDACESSFIELVTLTKNTDFLYLGIVFISLGIPYIAPFP